MQYIYTMECYSDLERNDLDTVIQHEVIEKEKKEISSGNNSGIQKNDTDELICKAETETDIEHGRMETGGREGYTMNWETGLDTHTLLGIKQITTENLLYSTGNSTQCYVVT